MKLLVMTDLEGVSGIVNWDRGEQAGPEDRAYQEFLLTNEVNGVVEGALRGGATEVWVVESHSIDVRQIHPAAMLHKGSHKVTPGLIGLRAGKWDAMAFVGNHAMAGPEGTLSHTQNLRVKSIRINGRLVGEFGIQAAIAGDHGMPMVLVTGDDVACRQALDLVPGVVTAAVKFATGRHSAWCMTPTNARELICARAEVAARGWREVSPLKIQGPVVFREELEDGMVREIAAPSVTEAFEMRCAVNV